MTSSTAQQTAETRPGRSITVALAPAARSRLGQIQEHTGLSQADLANCAITWYAYFDTQLRAGYNLTLWNDKGNACTLPFHAGCPAQAPRLRRVTSPAQPWLTVATSRGSPSAAPRGGVQQVHQVQQAYRPVARNEGSP
jgi:hypothetical protein